MAYDPELDPLAETVALAMAKHHLNDALDGCVCGGWGEGEMEPGWDDHMACVALVAVSDAGRLLPSSDDPYAPVSGSRCEAPDPDDQSLLCHRSPFHAAHAVDNATHRHIWVDSYTGGGA